MTLKMELLPPKCKQRRFLPIPNRAFHGFRRLAADYLTDEGASQNVSTIRLNHPGSTFLVQKLTQSSHKPSNTKTSATRKLLRLLHLQNGPGPS